VLRRATLYGTRTTHRHPRRRLRRLRHRYLAL